MNDKTRMMEDNLGLLYKYYTRHSYWTDEYEDIRQECAFAYCVAITKYDDASSYALSTYVWKSIDNHLKKMHYLRSMQKRTFAEGTKYFSFNQKCKDNYSDETFEYTELVGYDDEEYDRIDTWCAFEIARSKMTRKQNEAIDLKLAGNTNEKAAKILGQSTSAVTEKLRRCRPIIMKELQRGV